MTQALAVLQWAVSAGLAMLGLLTLVSWLRHRGRSRLYLALAVGLFGLLAVLGQVTQAAGTARMPVTVISLALLMGSAYAFLLFRHSLITVGRRALGLWTGAVILVTAAAIVANLGEATSRPVHLALTADLILVLAWCAVVGESIVKLWRVSGALPSVQRARLRALNAGFTGIVLALLGAGVAAVAASGTAADLAIDSVVLVSIPLLGIALSPPVWLRRIWREREEVQLRLAISQLLLYSPDEATLAERASEWAARLLGGAGALIALDGRVLAASGIAAAAVGQLHIDIDGITESPSLAFNTSLGTIAVAPIHSEAGTGYLAVLGGPFTPLFGDEELARLSQYAVSITVALDRVHLVGGVRRNAELLDLAHDAIFSWDFASRQNQYWNKAASELYGFSATEALGSDAHDLLHTQYPVPVDSILTDLLEKDHWEGHLVQRTKDGRTLPISARWALRRDANGAPVTVLEINRDISDENRVADELRRARDAAELASNAKSQYLSRMSHELRTPLAAMLGFSDLLEMRDPRDDQMVAIDAIQRAGAHLLGMVNDVLDIARIDAGRESLSLQPVDVSSVLEESGGLVGQSAAARRVTITSRLDGAGDIYVLADRQRLVQVLLNLLSNAIKYGAEGGHIIVGAAARDGFVDIDVIDDGPGLEEGYAARLFQPFERLGAERGHVPGTGLGLALSRQLAVGMGGSLEARSVRGEGAAFTVRLQQATGTDRPLVVPARAPSVLADGVAEHTVLVVEDNLATIALVESVFALRPTIRLLTAMQGSIAVELAREHLPGLIVLDLHLPDLDGAEVIGRLRADPRTAAIPVVMYSADATEREVQRLLAAGAVAYLTKPAKVTEFLAMVDGILGKAATTPTRS